MYDNLLKTISTQTIYSKGLFEFSKVSIWDICPIKKTAFAAGWCCHSWRYG